MIKKILIAVVCLAPLAIPFLIATSDEFPSWAYPVDPAPQPQGAPGPGGPKPPPRPAEFKDDGSLVHVPGSDAGYTRTQIRDAVPDWHPEDHPAMPDIVGKGRDKVRACAYCHQPNGAGRPESTSLAGLPEGYIKQEVGNFKMGLRKGSAPKRALQNQMNEIAANVSDADLAEAAAYFSSLKLGSYLKVVEAEMAPKTFVTGGMLAAEPEGEMEPIGKRIIEVPDDLERALARDSHVSFTAYVPKGSIDKGRTLVTTGGGKTTACATCHGADLHGQGDVPHIAGRSPSYVIRQLYDIQHNTRTGSVTFMQQVVANLGMDDMINIAAYIASREP